MEVGGFRPPDSPFTSWFGRVSFMAAREEWPTHDGRPMVALAQVNMAEMPFRPPRMNDFDFLTVFVAAQGLPHAHEPNGSAWCLRTYTLDEVVAVEPPETGTHIRPFPMRPSVVEEDYPCHEDLVTVPSEELVQDYHDAFDNQGGFKLGGWPTLIQSEIFWAPWQKHPATPEFVFQIDSCEKAGWQWGHGGVGYFGRGTAEGQRDVWAHEWQCL